MNYNRFYTPVLGESKIPEEGDLLSPMYCNACYYEHPMKWITNELSSGNFLVCYRCDNFIIPFSKKKRVAVEEIEDLIPPPPPVKRD